MHESAHPVLSLLYSPQSRLAAQELQTIPQTAPEANFNPDSPSQLCPEACLFSVELTMIIFRVGNYSFLKEVDLKSYNEKFPNCFYSHSSFYCGQIKMKLGPGGDGARL